MNEPKRRGRPPKAREEGQSEPINIGHAQAYALRVWDGQSPDLSRAERMARVKEALEAQGLSMEGVEL